MQKKSERNKLLFCSAEVQLIFYKDSIKLLKQQVKGLYFVELWLFPANSNAAGWC